MRWAGTSAPAKVNLFLRVMAREENGYHQIETLFQALDVEDEVHVRAAPRGVELEVEGTEPCPARENLAHRAAVAYLERTGIARGVHIRLVKRIPAKGGLGGGSSDAAAVLRVMNALFEGELAPEELAALGAGLGADVPFFLSPSPLALGWGRGDRLLPLPPLPPAPVLLAVPSFGVDTRRAFAALAESRSSDGSPRPAGVLDPEWLVSWEGVAHLAANDFHAPLFALRPELRRLREAMAATGARLSLLSGSGSTLFAVFDGAPARDAAREELRRRFRQVAWVPARTLDAMPR